MEKKSISEDSLTQINLISKFKRIKIIYSHEGKTYDYFIPSLYHMQTLNSMKCFRVYLYLYFYISIFTSLEVVNLSVVIDT